VYPIGSQPSLYLPLRDNVLFPPDPLYVGGRGSLIGGA